MKKINTRRLVKIRHNRPTKILAAGGLINSMDKTLTKRYSDIYKPEDLKRFKELLDPNYTFAYTPDELELIQKMQNLQSKGLTDFQSMQDTTTNVLGTAGGIGGLIIGGPAGATIGTTLGTLAGKGLDKASDSLLFNNPDYKRIDKTLKDYNTKYDKFNYDKANLDIRGKDISTIFAKGGELDNNPSGRNLVPISSTTEVVKGATHEQGGVQLASGEEVEKDEVIEDNKVFSDRLKYKNGTFADEAKRLGKIKGKYEDLLNSPDQTNKTTAERMIMQVDKQLDDLYRMQEQVKPNVNTGNKAAFGDTLSSTPFVKNYGYTDEYLLPELADLFNKSKTDMNGVVRDTPKTKNSFTTNASEAIATIGKKVQEADIMKKLKTLDTREVAANLLPLTDNLINANLINKTPTVPNPRLQEYVKLNTNYDISAPIAENQQLLDRFNKTVDRNTSSSGISTSRKMQALSKAMDASSALHSTKANKETTLKNAEILANSKINAENLAKLSANDMLKLKREAGILSDKAANAKNLSEDFKYMIDRADINDYQTKQLILDAANYKTTTAIRAEIESGAVDKELSTNLTRAQAYVDILAARGLPADIEAINKILKLNPNVKYTPKKR